MLLDETWKAEHLEIFEVMGIAFGLRCILVVFHRKCIKTNCKLGCGTWRQKE